MPLSIKLLVGTLVAELEDTQAPELVFVLAFSARDSRFLFITINLMFTKSLVS